MRQESGQRLLLDAREELQLETVDRAEDQSELASTAIPALITASQALQSLAGVLLGERDTSATREIRRRLNALEWNTLRLERTGVGLSESQLRPVLERVTHEAVDLLTALKHLDQ
jgi:hypothetical protein